MSTINQFITTPKKNKSKNETSIIKNLPKKKKIEKESTFSLQSFVVVIFLLIIFFFVKI